jgi:hypothetical protein
LVEPSAGVLKKLFRSIIQNYRVSGDARENEGDLGAHQPAPTTPIFI